MIRIPLLPPPATAALGYTPPHAYAVGKRLITLSSIVEAVDHKQNIIEPARTTALIDHVLHRTDLPEYERAYTLLTISTLNSDNIPAEKAELLASAIDMFKADRSQPALAFAAIIAEKVRSKERILTPIDFPNAIYEEFPGQLKILAAKSLAAKWGYNHVYVRHIVSRILGERNADTLSAAAYELRLSGIDACIFIPELMMLYATPTIHGLTTFFGTRTMKEIETTISIMSGAIIYALGIELTRLKASRNNTRATRRVLDRIERLAEPVPRLAAWTIPHLEKVRTMQHKKGGARSTFLIDTTLRKIKRWNNE